MIEGFFGGLKFLILGFLGGRKIWQIFFGGGLISRDFLAIQNNLKIHDSARIHPTCILAALFCD